ncbi:MAG: stage II sporulation protein M [Myxococcales bacterium]|nr:stage II sporulation protein M [Myxococcales bacterium]
MALTSALSEQAFAERRATDWEALADLASRASRSPRKLSAGDVERLSPLYRNVCADLAYAQSAHYSAPLADYLRDLTAAAHAALYGRTKRRGRGEVLRVWMGAFPRAVRRHHRVMWLAAALFFGSFALGFALALRDPTFAFRVVPEGMLRPLAEAYARGFGEGREAGEGALMAGFYVNNNVGIALRCFAVGIFGGLPTAFYLVHNGLSIGATLGYVAAQGAGFNVLTFVVGHGSLELGAIVLAGGAGMALGWSVVAPGELTRAASLQRAARDVVVIVFGAAVMLVFAAGLEAFWSASSLPAVVKLSVGAALFVLVALYLTLAGRGEEGRA